MTAEHTRAALVDQLRFQVESGVDFAVEDAPQDWIALQTQADAQRKEKIINPPPIDPNLKQAPSRAQSPVAAYLPAPRPQSETVEDARKRAEEANSLDELRSILMNFDGCSLKRTAKSLVFSDGDPSSKIMFVGEAPGREEDIKGLPFVGRSGQLLDRMLAAIGLKRHSVYIANVVPWRPPGNRTPSPEETEICRPFIERQITLVQPKVLVMLGGAAAKQLLDTSEGIMRLRGKWLRYQGKSFQTDAMATLHPAYLLRSPAQKRLAWRDFQAIKSALES